MRWPWEFLMKAKATDRESTKDVTDPARVEVAKSQDRIARINRILSEARNAQNLAQNRGK